MSAKPRIIHVTWEDHFANSDGWEQLASYRFKPAALCETAGYLIYETKSELHVALSIGYDEDRKDYQFADSICILKKCVVKRRYLK